MILFKEKQREMIASISFSLSKGKMFRSQSVAGLDRAKSNEVRPERGE